MRGSYSRRTRGIRLYSRLSLVAIAGLLWLITASFVSVCDAISSSDVGANDANTNADANAISDDGDYCECLQPSDYYQVEDEPEAPAARMAYLVSVHNQRTLRDAVHLVEALIQTSLEGSTAIILVHVDARLGISTTDRTEDSRHRETKTDANAENGGGDDESTLRHLYRDSDLRHLIESGCTCGTSIQVESHFSPEWGQWSMNDPTHWAMDVLTNDPEFRGAWDVFVNLSGDSMPVLPGERIARMFGRDDDADVGGVHTGGPLRGINFVTSSSCSTGLLPTSVRHFPQGWHKRVHYEGTGIPPMTFVEEDGTLREHVQIEIYFGSQWMVLTSDFVGYVVRGLSRPNSLASVLKTALIERKLWMTDETFLPTLIANSPYHSTLPNVDENDTLHSLPGMTAIRYERMDEQAPDAWKHVSTVPRYEVPPNFGKVTGGEDGPRPWGPYFLGTYDLAGIKASGALFVRKVSESVDGNLVRMLPVDYHEQLPDIDWPENGIRVADPLAWEMEQLLAKKKEERENNKEKH